MNLAIKTGKIIKWFIGNCIWYGSGILGILYHISPAYNVFVFNTWALFLLGMCTWIYVADHYKNDKEIDGGAELYLPVIPYQVDVILDIAFILLMVAFGHWFYGLITVFHVMMYCDSIPHLKKISARTLKLRSHSLAD